MGMREKCVSQKEGAGSEGGRGVGFGGGQRQPSQGWASRNVPAPPTRDSLRRREPTLNAGNENPGRRDAGRHLAGRGPGHHPQGSRATSPRLLSKLGILGRPCCRNVAIGLNKCKPENKGYHSEEKNSILAVRVCAITRGVGKERRERGGATPTGWN